MEATRPSGELTVNPKEYLKNKKMESTYKEKRKKKKKSKKSQQSPAVR